MSDFIGNLLLTSVICSIIVLIALAISPLLKKYTKKWRYVVFILIAVKLLLPMPIYTAENAIVIPMAREANPTTNKATNSVANKNAANENANVVKENVVNQNNQQALQAENNIAQVSQVKNNTANDREEQLANSENIKTETAENELVSFIYNIEMDIVYMVIFIIWCAGVVGFGLYYTLMYFYHRKNLNRWSTNITEENVLVILEEEKARLGITKNIVLKKCKKISTPMTLGFRHLSIVLPYTEYSKESVRYIFRHELTHQKRHDIYAKVLFIACKCLHWFNPIVPMMVNRAYDDMEILCDDMVVADMQKEQRIAYNEVILSIAKSKAEEVTGKNILFAFCFVEKERNLKERVKNIMIMGKRKKGYQIVALAIAVIVAGSCFISCDKKSEEAKEPKTTVATDDYNEYLKKVLIPEFGLADLSKFTATIEAKQDGNYYITDRKINLNGIVSAYVDDMNADGVDDMIVVRYKKGVGAEKKDKRFEMVLGAYTIKDGQIILLDEIEACAPHNVNDNETTHIEKISEKESADRNVYVNAITDGTNKYIMLESNEWVQVFADGLYQYNVVYQLDGEELKAKYSFEQTAGGSAGFQFTGYIDDKGTLLWNEYADMEGEEPGKYETFRDALLGFYGDLGISVQTSVGGNASYLKESIISKKSLVSNIFSYNWNMSAWSGEDSEGTSATFEQTAKDYTNVLDVAGVTAEEIAKESESGTSKEAMEVFEKIQNDESYAGPLLLNAIVINSVFSEEIKNEAWYYYWKSASWALSSIDYEEIFKEYDVKLINNTEKGETYFIAEPRVIDTLARVFTGTYLPPTAIPYEHPEFAEQESGTSSYPYMIYYNNEEGKYYVGYGELGSVNFTDCTYKVNDNDTMTIRGKYIGSESNPDEYLFDNYEITIGYDPGNEVYGFTILDVKAL